MAKRKASEAPRGKTTADRRLRAVYAKSKAQFSAADLQKFTDTEDGIPIEQVLGELEDSHRKLSRKKS